jgi:pantetheine-phosphate adenylyltransferase
MSHRLAVYPGSFDPLHNGHLDIVERCLRNFDEVLVAVLRNEEKKPRFSVDERLDMLREVLAPLGRCRVESFTGLLVDFVDRVGAITIVRGLRAVSDFEYEFQMALMNRRLNPRVETVSRCRKSTATPAGWSRSSNRRRRGLVPARVLRAALAARRRAPPAGGRLLGR